MLCIFVFKAIYSKRKKIGVIKKKKKKLLISLKLHSFLSTEVYKHVMFDISIKRYSCDWHDVIIGVWKHKLSIPRVYTLNANFLIKNTRQYKYNITIMIPISVKNKLWNKRIGSIKKIPNLISFIDRRFVTSEHCTSNPTKRQLIRLNTL